MFYTLGVLAILVLSVVWIVHTIIRFPFFIKELARKDMLFTTVKEGTVKAVVRGESFDHFIMGFAGYHLNDPRWKDADKQGWKRDLYREEFPDWEVLYHGPRNPYGFEETDDSYYDVRHTNGLFDKFLKHFGIHWIGWPWSHSIYVYEFEWNEIYTDGNGVAQILSRDEPTDFIFVADFTYAIKTVGAETQDLLPTDELTLATIVVRNPYRALFSGEDWMQRITAAINGHVRAFVGNMNYQDLIGKNIEGSDAPEASDDYWYERFSKPIIDLTDKLPSDKGRDQSKVSGLRGRYGIKIRTADLQTMDLSGGEGKKQQQEATTKAYVAQQEAKATKLEGRAKADVVIMNGEAEAAALKARVEVIDSSDSGKLLAQLDAMRKASEGDGNTVIWANDPFVALAGKMLKPETKGGES